MFEKGQLVVCVDDGPGLLKNATPCTGLKAGIVYTVKQTGAWLWSTEEYNGVRLVETNNGADTPYLPSRFRPLPSSQISLVNSMLVTKKAKEPVLSGEQGDAA